MKIKQLRIQPRILTNYLEHAFGNGRYKLTYEQIALGLWPKLKVPNELHTRAIRKAWPRAERELRRRDMCAILVTAMYFEDFPRSEPRNPDAITHCIAYHWRGAAGIRLLTAKNIRNDPMALVYFALRARNVKGTVAAIEDRATVEWLRGKLGKRTAMRLIDKVNELALPEHQIEFAELMGSNPNAI
jgi:hypothetical protein